MIIDYSAQKTFAMSLDVVDAGNCCIKCTNIDGCEYYVITKTVYGKVSLITFGPVLPDFPALLEDFSVSYKKFDYKEQTIQKEISKYMNDPKKKIADAENWTEYEAWQCFPNVEESFNEV